MKHPANPQVELQDAIRDGRAVIVAGSGVSLAASRDPATGRSHRQASWSGLLESGLEWLRARELISEDRAHAHLILLQGDSDTHHFISAAQDVTRHLGGTQSKHFADWLARTIGTVAAHDRSVLDACDLLRKHGNLLATTNYDGLLLGDATSLKPVTWRDTDAFLRAARNRETDKIMFLHGYWRQPESVILDWQSYESITRDQRYRDELAAVWQMTTWVYIGCGVNGLNDPDFGLLLERYGRRARQAELWDFCLVRQSQVAEFQAHFDKLDVNICAVSVGDSHDCLPRYLRSLLPGPPSQSDSTTVIRAGVERGPIPEPPDLYAEPDYIGSHRFIGRDTQLQDLSDWARAADPTNLLLYEAIGGNGKSMLTWEWTTRHATTVRADWAGRFWYSFYERGADMADFCRHALAYMTDARLEEFAKVNMSALARHLMAKLHEHPWLLVLDGLERVLVAYHHVDAAEMPDEQANAPTDKVLNRNPCDTIRDEDAGLLRALAGARPSKILVTSRLAPRALLNPSGQAIPGAKRVALPGLRPTDAEQLLRSCGVTGDSTAMQDYVAQNCDNHPLLIGVLAGLITHYLPGKGNFDAWLADPGSHGGAKLNLATLDLIHRRNHILRAALDALPEKSRELLSTLALLSEAADYQTLAAFNPHMPPEPEYVNEPQLPHEHSYWESLSDERKKGIVDDYDAALARRHSYEMAVQAWRESAAVHLAPDKLADTVKDLEQRGLLQYDGHTRRHDLHPVVRGVASGGMKTEEKDRYGQRVVDYLSSMSYSPYKDAKTLEDMGHGLHVVRTLLKLGRLQEASNSWSAFASALFWNVEGYAESLSLLRPFFAAGWGELPKGLDSRIGSMLANDAAVALHYCGELVASLAAYGAAIVADLEAGRWGMLSVGLRNFALTLTNQNLLAKAFRTDSLALGVATSMEDHDYIFLGRLDLFADQVRIGRWADGEATWHLLERMSRPKFRAIYRPGRAELWFSRLQFWKGTLEENHLAAAERLAVEGRNRTETRELHALRGAWRLERSEWAIAAASFHEAVRMARERRLTDEQSEAGLALAKLHLGQLRHADEARHEVERLSGQRNPAHRYIALLWRTIGDHARAEKHALDAYRSAWADGEPYVWRYELSKSAELLQQMNVPIPTLPLHNPVDEKPFPWEADVRAAITRIQAEKQAGRVKKE